MARAVLADGGFDVAGEIANAESALEAALRPGPDCVSVDVHLGDADGFAVADESAARHGPVVVLTSGCDRRDLEPGIRQSAARGFIAKDRPSASALGSSSSEHRRRPGGHATAGAAFTLTVSGAALAAGAIAVAHRAARDQTTTLAAAGRRVLGSCLAGGAPRGALGAILITLDDRVQAFAGTLRIVSPPGNGTRVIAELPLRDQRVHDPDVRLPAAAAATAVVDLDRRVPPAAREPHPGPSLPGGDGADDRHRPGDRLGDRSAATGVHPYPRIERLAVLTCPIGVIG
jgi:CheY-like chemotaxis protein